MTIIPPNVFRRRSRLKVVLFSGGRGSAAFAEQLIQHPRIDLTVAINGYDDGASTGEIRRFLGDALGPSDFRKNSSRLAKLRKTCSPALIDILDQRLPHDASIEHIDRLIGELHASHDVAQEQTAQRLRQFAEAYRSSGRAVDFRDAAVGNFVFAGSF